MTYQFPPRLMKAAAAAHYLGISETKLRSLSLPQRRHGGNVLYDIRDLDDYADAIPYEAQDRVQENGGW